MKLFCNALASGKYIPTKYANKGVSGGQNISLPLSWTEIPNGTKSFALTIVDRHPTAKGFVHWLVVNISEHARGITEGASRGLKRLPEGSIELQNSFGEVGYGGPQPPKGAGPHEYVITLYALDVPDLQLGPISPFKQFLGELAGKVLDSATLVGVFSW